MWRRVVFMASGVALASAALRYTAFQTPLYSEPDDFNVTKALLKYGVDVSALPGLAAPQGRSANLACSIACASLLSLYGHDHVHAPGSAPYANFTASYWSQLQEEVSPACIFSPAAPAQVSVVVLLSRLTQCPFAARSGGHAAFPGASSIEGGITVSLRKLRAIALSSDRTTASVQPGNTWYAVYNALAAYGLAVIGGRVSAIGVGGLTTGGGISFFSNMYGWACDNVASYDVVTATGEIITATPTDFPDLYWALRGGGNNFGLVVNFELRTIPLPGGAMWGGSRVFTDEATFPAVVEAFTALIAESPSDRNAGAWVAWVLYSGARLCSTELWYAKPNGGDAAIFRNFNSITPRSDTTRNITLADYTVQVNLANPKGFREVYYTMSFKLCLETAHAALRIFWEEIKAVADVEGIVPSMVWQGITEGVLEAMAQNGGNPLGISQDDGPYVLIDFACSWAKAQDDAAVYHAISTILTRIKAAASAHQAQSDYLYMNYASQFQDVIGSYGPDNKARLKRVARRYDPAQVFQVLQPGYFKLDRAPVPNSTYFL